ncbi:MAG TPA: ABC transporter ATP-binding protein [Rhodoferax sp.]|nr:ABC transporter ATP-binding protein [Rhodoferax sp.]
MSMVSVRGVTKSFPVDGGVVNAISVVDLDIAFGEFVSIIGPSGCGKSTLLRILAGLEQQTAGDITWEDNKGRDKVGFVFQEPVLLPWKSALANICFALEAFGTRGEAAEVEGRRLLKLVGLEQFADALPRQLSGGMRQRVAIARALSYDPHILLMDEPFGALDLLTRDKLNDELADIWAKTGKTIVLVTHSVEEAAYLSDRLVVMSARPGVIKRIYDVPFARPRSEATKLLPEFHRLMADLRRDLK